MLFDPGTRNTPGANLIIQIEPVDTNLKCYFSQKYEAGIFRNLIFG